MNTNASKTRIKYDRLALIALLILPILFSYLATPVVVVKFSHEGEEDYLYIWNTQDRIYKGEMPKGGGSAIEWGHIFPDKDFFMRFDWWKKRGLQMCIDITPKWGRTINIYVDEVGRIDTAKTAPYVIARLKQCQGEPDPFRLR